MTTESSQSSNDEGGGGVVGASTSSTTASSSASRTPLEDKSNISAPSSSSGADALSTESIKQMIAAAGSNSNQKAFASSTKTGSFSSPTVAVLPPASAKPSSTAAASSSSSLKKKSSFGLGSSLDDDSSDDEELDALLTMSSGLGSSKHKTSSTNLDRKPAAKPSVLLSKPRSRAPTPSSVPSSTSTTAAPSSSSAAAVAPPAPVTSSTASVTTVRPEAPVSSSSIIASMVPSVASLPSISSRPSANVARAARELVQDLMPASAPSSSAAARLTGVPLPVFSAPAAAAAAPPSLSRNSSTSMDDKSNNNNNGSDSDNNAPAPASIPGQPRMGLEDMQEEFDKLLAEQQDQLMKKVPKRKMPKRVHAKFYSYQEEGVRWLIHKETTFDEISPFYEIKKPMVGPPMYECMLRGDRFMERPQPTRGSILADDMGLGKTLQTIGLIMGNPPEGRDGKKKYPYKKPTSQIQAPRCTLIVSPVSVMSNWKMELRKFVNKDRDILEVAFYRGPTREKQLGRLKNQELDILIASYQTLMFDFKKYQLHMKEQKKRKEAGKPVRPSNKLFIHDMTFHRIVLDEAHTIRNGESTTFKAINALKANNKLCLTGTPFVNRPNDIHSLFQFLQVDTLKEKKFFNRHIVSPIQRNHEFGLALTRVIMGQIALRRTKDQVEHLVKLPDKTVIEYKIGFEDSLHGSTHDILYEACRLAFQGLLKADDATIYKNYFLVFKLVLRVRQSCCHGGLIPQEEREFFKAFRDEFEGTNFELLERQQGIDLFRKLIQHLGRRDDDEEEGQQQTEGESEPVECAICLEELIEESAMILRTCEHVFCQPCLDKVTNHTCPLCRAPYTPGDKVSSARLKESAEQPEQPAGDNAAENIGADFESFPLAPKTEALMNAIEEMKDDEKGVIFSQWTSHLNIVERELKNQGHTFCRIQGGMSVDQRLHAMEIFSSEDSDYNQDVNPRFMLCSLMACGTGITLTRANHVYMMDPWWNAAAENQAMDRIYRIGQTRPVRAVRFVMEDTMEERLHRLQDAKQKLGKGTMQRLRPEERKKAKMTAMKDLFEIDQEDVMWHGKFNDEEVEDIERKNMQKYQSGSRRASSGSDERSDDDDDGSDLDDFIVNDDDSLSVYGSDGDAEYRPKEEKKKKKKRKGRKGKAAAKKPRKKYIVDSDSSDDDEELELYYSDKEEDSKPAAKEEEDSKPAAKEEPAPMDIAAPETEATESAAAKDEEDAKPAAKEEAAPMDIVAPETQASGSVTAPKDGEAEAAEVASASTTKAEEESSSTKIGDVVDKAATETPVEANESLKEPVAEKPDDIDVTMKDTEDENVSKEKDVAMKSGDDEPIAEVVTDTTEASTSSTDANETEAEESPSSKEEEKTETTSEEKTISPVVTRSRRRGKREKTEATPNPPPLRRSARRRAA